MIFPLACVGLLLVLLVPLPPAVLDLLLVINLTLSVIILVTTIYVSTPREFAVFPSLLLSITLLRLVLNVATTRLILSGDGSPSSAGEVVRTFSDFVTSGKVAVGAIIFLIIFVIQFVVITKGGSRISEVAARFVLDALPGRQMAIDSDVSAGQIDQKEARHRREQLARDADFYSAMDGAGKFVRGDAIACVIITLINLIAGFCIGISNGKGLEECLSAYTKLTIGDGLVSQIPAFIVSLGAGLIVTRSSKASDLGEDVIGQLLAKPKALIVAAIFLAVLAFMGMPKIPLLVLGACCVLLAYVLRPQAIAPETETVDAPLSKESPGVERLLGLDTLEVVLGRGLARLADPARDGDLLQRVAAVRESIARELGIIVPDVSIADSDSIGVNDYAVKIRGQMIARGVAYPQQFLAIDDGEATGAIAHGEETADPARGRLAYWITDSQIEEAQELGYIVSESPAVLMSHVTEVIRAHAHELLTRQTVKDLLDHLRTRSAAVVDEVAAAQIKPGDLQKVLQNLLRERVPVRDLETIMETIGDYASRTKDPDLLTEYVRIALARTICKQYVDDDGRLACLMLDPALEELIAGHVEQANGNAGSIHIGAINTMPPATAQRIGQEIAEHAATIARDGGHAVVLCAPAVRSAVRRLLEPHAPQVAVLSLSEVVGDVSVEVVGVVGESSANISANIADEREPGNRMVEDGYESANV